MKIEDDFFYKNFRRKGLKLSLDNITEFIKRNFKNLKFKQKRNLLILGVCCLFYFLFFSAPNKNFSNGGFVFDISEGMNVSIISQNLKKDDLIRSPLTFKIILKLTRNEDNVQAGGYLFEKPQNLPTVIWRIIKGKQGYDPIRLSIPEGATVNEISLLAKEKIEAFDREKFLELAKGEEGYLFPETYHLSPDTTEEVLLKTMKNTFMEKIQSLLPMIKDSGHSLHDILTMASILEEEARTMETRQMIAGILWKRIEIGMPLQVDATFMYINGKNTYELTTADLRDDSSPYNTYAYKDLPPGPISNPGLDAIWAALNPTKSNYLYYLSDKSGNMYYARTFEEHKENKTKYLHTY